MNPYKSAPSLRHVDDFPAFGTWMTSQRTDTSTFASQWEGVFDISKTTKYDLENKHCCSSFDGGSSV